MATNDVTTVNGCLTLTFGVVLSVISLVKKTGVLTDYSVDGGLGRNCERTIMPSHGPLMHTCTHTYTIVLTTIEIVEGTRLALMPETDGLRDVVQDGISNRPTVNYGTQPVATTDLVAGTITRLRCPERNYSTTG